MKTYRREILFSVLVLLLTLGAGFLIQSILYLRDVRAADLRARVIVSDTLQDIQAFGDSEHARFSAAAERMADLPREKRERLEEGKRVTLRLQLLLPEGIEVTPCVPSLFTLKIGLISYLNRLFFKKVGLRTCLLP